MTYKEIVTYIEEIPRFTRKHSLDHTREMLLFLGNPQNGKKIIHVAGTNGKGSVCAYLDAMLRAEGKSTGLFTSPHLVKMNERIVLNGKQISDTAKIIADKTSDNGQERTFRCSFNLKSLKYDNRASYYLVIADETGLQMPQKEEFQIDIAFAVDEFNFFS
jgi:folylpolyglutamate synthase/dihydropteroate synthase